MRECRKPSCHANHLPPYAAKYDEFKSKGVDAVYVLSANDPFVLSGWTRVQGVADKIVSLTDIDGAWSKELGLLADLSGLGIGLGVRTTRYALVLDDLVVKYLGVEKNPSEVTVSGADAVLAAL